MKLVAQLALGTWLGLGLTVFCCWATWLAVSKEVTASAGWTERVLFMVGRSCIWGGAAVLAGAVAGAMAMVVWRAVGP